MTFAAPDALPSGKPYPVTQVGEETPTSLEQFVGEGAFGVDLGGGGASRVTGVGARTDDVVRFHEKDLGSSGKDVRVWTIRQQGEAFTAELASLY